MNDYELVPSVNPILMKSVGCNLEFCSICFNCFTSLGVVALIIFLCGSGSFCDDSSGSWCDVFAGELGVLYCFILMFALCCSPCFFDCFLSILQLQAQRCKEEPFDYRYRNIHEHTFIANEECVKNNNEDSDKETFATDICYKVPIIYSQKYNITAWGIEKIHPFDSRKYGRICEFLTTENIFSKTQIIEPPCASRADLLTVHTVLYLATLSSSWMVMKILELPGLCLLPAPILWWRVLLPMMYQCGGSILTVELAYKYGWAINLGGGFHHASSSRGGGFCVYADITMIVHYIRKSLRNGHGRNCRVLIIDLDAHQGNGHERDAKDFFRNDKNLKILDAYNCHIYPGDYYAAEAIDYAMKLFPGCNTEHFIQELNKYMEQAINVFDPQFIVYNAGTDCLIGDPLGAMRISEQGIVERDEIVFALARQINAPIVMVLSGGYQLNNARCIANSIKNLKQKGYLAMNK